MTNKAFLFPYNLDIKHFDWIHKISQHFHKQTFIGFLYHVLLKQAIFISLFYTTNPQSV